MKIVESFPDDKKVALLYFLNFMLAYIEIDLQSLDEKEVSEAGNKKSASM